MAHNKAGGGSGYEDLSNLSFFLKMRWYGRSMSKDLSIWVLLARESIACSLHLGYKHKMRCM